MTFPRAAVADLLSDAFAALSPAVPVDADENAQFTDRPTDSEWIRVRFRDGSEEQVSFGGAGGSLFRAPSLVFVDAFVPTNAGDGRAVELLAVARTQLRRLVVDSARWERFEAGPEGEAEGEYRKQLVAIFRDRVRV